MTVHQRDFNSLTSIVMNFLSLADAPGVECGEGRVRCAACQEVVGVLYNAVKLVNGEVLYPVITHTSIMEAVNALASHVVERHVGTSASPRQNPN